MQGISESASVGLSNGQSYGNSLKFLIFNSQRNLDLRNKDFVREKTNLVLGDW